MTKGADLPAAAVPWAGTNPATPPFLLLFGQAGARLRGT